MNLRLGKNNIERVYLAATEEEKSQGMAWYADARRFCRRMSKTYGIPFVNVIAVLAALSPRNKWSRNLQDTEAVLIAFTEGMGPEDVRVGTFNTNKEKAFRILQENNPLLVQTSNKVACFFDNIKDADSKLVTVDIWAFGIFMGYRAEQSTLTDTHYEVISSAYRSAAKKYNLRPYELQAICWIVFQRLTKSHRVVKVLAAQYNEGVRFDVAA